VRIDDLKLRWPTKIAALFWPDGEVNTLQTAGVLLCRRLATFLWWFGGLIQLAMGDWRRERENRRREEREALRCAMVETRARCTGAAEGCEPLDRR